MFFIHHANGRKLNSHINIIVLLVSKRFDKFQQSSKAKTLKKMIENKNDHLQMNKSVLIL